MKKQKLVAGFEYRPLIAASLLTALPLALTAPAYAAAADEGAATFAVEEIIVTATKRKETLQSVPMPVSAIGEEMLQNAGIVNFADYARMVPGVSFDFQGPAGGQTGNRAVTIRGISSDLGLVSNAGQPVGFYINETPVSFSDPNLFDIERIEVLRGPQGTLYGAGSMGGTVKIVTNKPDLTAFKARVEGDVSTTESGGENYELRGMANLPVVTDKLAVRLSGGYRRDSGFIDNDPRIIECAQPSAGCEIDTQIPGLKKAFNGERDHDRIEKKTARIAVQFQPTEELSITPSVFYEDTSVGGDSSFSYVRDANGNPAPVFGLRTHLQVPTPEENNFRLYDVTLNYDLGFASLTNSTSYFETVRKDIIDLTYLMQGLLTSIFPDDDSVARARNLQVPFNSQTNRESFVQETRLTSNGDGPLNWIVGGYFSDETIKFNNSSYSESIANDPLFSLVIPDGFVLASQSIIKTKQYAAFGELNYALTDRLNLIGGLRWFHVRNEQSRYTDGFLPGFQHPTLTPASESGVNPKLEVTYKAASDKLVYALASKGYRAGGVVAPPTIPSCAAELASYGFDSLPTSYESDSLWNYEVGAKTSWADGRVVLNAAAFWMDWKNIQQSLFLNCGTTIILNAGKATSKGVELEARISPAEGWDFGGALTYNKTKLGEDNPAGFGLKGDALIYVPEFSAAVNGQYSFPAFEDMTGYLRADYQYVGKSYTTLSPLGGGRDQDKMSDYGVASFRMGLKNDAWDSALYVNNAFNARPLYLNGTAGFGSQFEQATTIRPRTIGLTVRRNF